ncbi:MAG: DUF1127 domain-containing protein [Paracoccaceae bacterium]|jgi:uncharacterized protein YjiS (DUF1127 family)|nr:DUF1127 domain-containing protein [Paracoccaceae bacterium]
MAYVNHVPASFPGAALFERTVAFFRAQALVIAQYRAYLIAVEELEGLSDRELADIGVYRGSIKEVAARSAFCV